METDGKIAVFGAKGMVGSAIVRRLRARGYTNVLGIDRERCDLLRQADVEALFEHERPAYVMLAAARVGGIHANSTYPAQFIYDNLMIQCNIIHSAHIAGVKKLLFLGSSCIYPTMAPQPLKEEYLLTGQVEPTSEAYALAKIAGLKMCDHYHTQYGCNFISAMPTNLYGYGDNFHPENSHVIAGLMLRFHKAKLDGEPRVTCWGTGAPTREFLFIEDLAEALVHLMNHFDAPGFVNIGTGAEIRIADLVNLIAQTVGYAGEIIWDHDKPDGTPRKVVDTGKIEASGWRHKTNLAEGLRLTYQWFLENHDCLRQ